MKQLTRRILRGIAGALAAWGVVEFGLAHSYPHGRGLRVRRRVPADQGNTSENERPAQP